MINVLRGSHLYWVFIKYCVFSRSFKNIPDPGLFLFSLGFSVCTHTRQVENQRCSRTGRVQKNHKILRENTIFNENPIHRFLKFSVNLRRYLKRTEVAFSLYPLLQLEDFAEFCTLYVGYKRQYKLEN